LNGWQNKINTARGKQMKFTKMHGIGNDYVYVNCMQAPIEQPAAVSRFVSDRHYGIGADGLILICPSQVADFEMKMFNANGSQAEMCGNGIRCVGKYVYDHGLTNKTNLRIETLSGVKHLSLTIAEHQVERVTVNMGIPMLEAAKIPVLTDVTQAIAIPLQVAEQVYQVTCVSMGNPHGVIFMKDDVRQLELEKIGPLFEHHPSFPKGINTEFVNIVSNKTIRMRVWERGSGETLACGTGACASAAAYILQHDPGSEVLVKLSGGDLQINWEGSNTDLFMTGAAATVFEGEIKLPYKLK
jgi:diaminopimelate epimerase